LKRNLRRKNDKLKRRRRETKRKVLKTKLNQMPEKSGANNIKYAWI